MDRPAAGPYGVVTKGLSMRGAVFLEGSVIEPATPFLGRGEYLRYWPQLYPFRLSGSAGEPLVIELRVHGHAATKNGLSSLIVSPEQDARRLYARHLTTDVGLALAFAAATGMAGLLAAFASSRMGKTGRLLFLVSLLALVAALRLLLNFAPDPPVPVRWWSALNLTLFVHISLLILTILADHLNLFRRRHVAWMLAGAAVTPMVLSSAPTRMLYPLAEGILVALAVAGVVLIARLIAQCRRHRRREDIKMLAVFGLVLGFSVHDLAVHLGPGTMSNSYLQVWSMPALILLMTALLIRNLVVQQELERALQRESERREDLLRDLHDGVGSRLVALSFHVRRKNADPAVVDELDGLINEIQLIQRTVRSGDSRLKILLADLRHLYSGIGGGALPLRWEVSESLPEYWLDAEQSVATVRILSEAVTNALKHADANEIRIRLDRRGPDGELRVSVSDDGVGQFRSKSGGGLRNIVLRAERAGLTVAFTEGVGTKAVELTFPDRPAASSWLARWRNRVRRA